jgi:hypothetical protein
MVLTCPHFQPRSLFEPNLCRYWKPVGQDHRGDPYPAHCSHREVLVCETMGLRVWRNDNDDEEVD